MTAKNRNGWGAGSALNTDTSGLKVSTVPTAVVLSANMSASNDTAVTISWNALITADLSNGGADVITYEVYWNAGIFASSFTLLTGSVSTPLITSSYTQDSGISAGNDYTFKVRAVNQFGEGSFSNLVSVRAASAPGTISAVGFILDSTSIRISWNIPNNHGATIRNYTILFKNAEAS